MQQWTNDKWRSTDHRVALPPIDSQINRISLAYFVGANYDASIECLDSCIEGDGPKYDPMTYFQWRKKRIARAMKELKKK